MKICGLPKGEVVEIISIPKTEESFQNCDSQLCQRTSTMNVPESNAQYVAIE